MKRTNSYSQKMQFIIRIFSLIGLIILVISNINRAINYYFGKLDNLNLELSSFIGNTINNK